MSSRTLLSAASVVLAIAGVALLFAPDECLRLLSGPVATSNSLAGQLLGAALFAFAMVDRMAQGTPVGGIYGRPIAIGNFTQFAIGAVTLLREQVSNPTMAGWIVGAIWTIFAIGFGWLLFGPPPVVHQD